MATVTNKTTLFNALTIVSPGLSKGREVCEQSGCFVFADGWVYTFNEEVACRAPLDIGVAGALPHKGLLQLLDKMPDENITIEDTEAAVFFKGSGRRLTITKQAEIVLPTHLVEMPEAFAPIPSGLVEACVIAAGCTKKDSDKFLAQCVHFGPDWVEACDNQQVSRLEIPGLGCELLVRGATIRQIGDMHFTEWALTTSWIHFTNSTGAIFSCRTHTRDYIDLNSLLEADPGVPVALPGGLQEIIQRANIASQLAIGEDVIRVDLRSNRLKITAQGTDIKFEEFVPVVYGGPDMGFTVSPALLVELAKAHTQVHLSEGRLCVKSGGMTYITSVHNV